MEPMVPGDTLLAFEGWVAVRDAGSQCDDDLKQGRDASHKRCHFMPSVGPLHCGRTFDAVSTRLDKTQPSASGTSGRKTCGK